jgi:hypothetical protein
MIDLAIRSFIPRSYAGRRSEGSEIRHAFAQTAQK